MTAAYPGTETATRLVTVPAAAILTLRRDGGALTAVRRGLAEYLLGARVPEGAGRDFALRAAFWDWAEPEDVREFPAVSIELDGDAEYDDPGFTPDLASAALLDRIARRALLQVSELRCDLLVRVWTTDPRARGELTAWAEDVLHPVDWSGGFQLALDHYHGVHAQYVLTALAYADNPDSARAGERVAVLTVAAAVPVFKLVTLPQIGDYRTGVVAQSEPL